MSRPIVTLRPLTRANLAAITPCFEDPDTRRYLGGPDWPAAMLAHASRCNPSCRARPPSTNARLTNSTDDSVLARPKAPNIGR